MKPLSRRGIAGVKFLFFISVVAYIVDGAPEAAYETGPDEVSLDDNVLAEVMLRGGRNEIPQYATSFNIFLDGKHCIGGQGCGVSTDSEAKTISVKAPGSKSVVIHAADPHCFLAYNFSAIPQDKRNHHFYLYDRGHETTFLPDINGTAEVPVEATQSMDDSTFEVMQVPSFKVDEETVSGARLNAEFFNKYDTISDAEAKKFKSNKCYDKCPGGQMLMYKLAKNSKFGFRLRLKKECSWVKLNMKYESKKKLGDDALPLSWNPHYALKISLANSFVIMPASMRAVPLSFDEYEEDIHVVNIHYDPAGNDGSPLTVASAFGDAAVADHAEHSDKIVFAFSQSNCLASPPEGALDSVQHGTTFFSDKDEKLVPGISAKFEPPKKIVKQNEMNVNSSTIRPAIESTTQANIEELTTTTIATTTMNIADYLRQASAQMKAGDAAKKARTFCSWRYWGLFTGFVAGSLLSFLLGMLIVYLLRRSFLVFWYREMYKRYGSDTTAGGTTMGATEQSETIGTTGGDQTSSSSTTTMGETEGGASTMGGTTDFSTVQG